MRQRRPGLLPAPLRVLGTLVLGVGLVLGLSAPAGAALPATPVTSADDGTDLSGAPDGIPGGIFPVSVSATLGRSGGVLRGTVGASSAVLTVPAGTFSGAVQVTLVQPPATTVPRGTSAVAAFGLRVAKDGRPVTGSFARSVTVALTGSTVSRADAAIYTPEGASTRNLPFVRSGRRVVVTLAGPVDRVTVLAPAGTAAPAKAAGGNAGLLGTVVRSASDGVTLRALLISLGLLGVFGGVLMLGFRRRAARVHPGERVALPAIGRIRTEPIEDPTVALSHLDDPTMALPRQRSFDWWGGKADRGEKAHAMARD